MIYYGFWCCKYANGTASLLHSMRCDKQKHFTHTKQKQKRSRPILCRSHTSQSQTLEPISVAVFAYDVPVSQSKYNSMVFFLFAHSFAIVLLRVMLFSRCLDRIKRAPHTYEHPKPKRKRESVLFTCNL